MELFSRFIFTISFLRGVVAMYYDMNEDFSNLVIVAQKNHVLLTECMLFCTKLNAITLSKDEEDIRSDCICVKKKENDGFFSTALVDTEKYVMYTPFESNLSEGKPAEQSSTVYDFAASRAFDGNVHQYLSDNSCSHTNWQQPVWLRVDLQKSCIITRVKIYNLISHAYRLKNAKIEVAASSDMLKSKQICAKVPKITTLDQIQSFDCSPYTTGRYVQLIKKREEYLNVCEMQVFGYENMFYDLN
ncbi:uncharacterized protein LOC130640682 [Hydractinia symbiolongicarpus]|uniref:uncharacterized protein LOC130640682 n=1 Tax=Hydractinia symbiolongicarpus TaxID=13093 RepID=UPI00254EBBBA|nr:uncharacterized protein LOC130640682 [Hydractinia symbiolongicarpus]